ncbi:acyltransferase [Novosphingobium sp. BL-8H]|uniref:acyltransferase family protein n=1 Tax=Novosphingobium sp. BL-8H TaxID=3127640 RepID=UPI00375763CA
MLDGLRGVAALLVVIQHALEKAWPGAWLLHSCNLGRVGVLLFFLISGYVLPYSLRGERPLKRFGISRVFRLLPALWLAIALELLLKGWQNPATVLANMLMIAGPLGLQALSGVYWTLTIELLLYLYCAALTFAGLLHRPHVSAIFGLSLGLCALVTGTELLSFPAYLLLGLLVRRAHDGDARALWWAGILLAVLVAAGLRIAIGLNWDPDFPPMARATGTLFPLIAFLTCIRTSRTTPRWLIHMGAISYSMYLFQDVGLIGLASLLPVLPAAYFVGVLVITIAIAAVVHRLVEVPFIALGRRLAARPAHGNAPQSLVATPTSLS